MTVINYNDFITRYKFCFIYIEKYIRQKCENIYMVHLFKIRIEGDLYNTSFSSGSVRV